MRLFAVLIVAAALAAFPAWAGGGYRLGVTGLSCPFCAYGIEKQLGRIAGVETVLTEIESGTVAVTMEEGATLEESVAKKAVEDAGFTLRSFERKPVAE